MNKKSLDDLSQYSTLGVSLLQLMGSLIILGILLFVIFHFFFE